MDNTCLSCGHPKSSHCGGRCDHKKFVGMNKSVNSIYPVYASCHCSGFVGQDKIYTQDGKENNERQ